MNETLAQKDFIATQGPPLKYEMQKNKQLLVWKIIEGLTRFRNKQLFS